MKNPILNKVRPQHIRVGPFKSPFLTEYPTLCALSDSVGCSKFVSPSMNMYSCAAKSIRETNSAKKKRQTYFCRLKHRTANPAFIPIKVMIAKHTNQMFLKSYKLLFTLMYAKSEKATICIKVLTI